MLIAQISDTHIGQHGPDDPLTLARIGALEAFATHIGTMGEKPDLVLHTGDVTHSGRPEDYAAVKSAMGALDIPVFFALGNRDLDANLVEGLKGLGGADLVDGFLIYSVDQFPVRLVAMDTQHRGHRLGMVCPARLRILDELLKQRPEAPTALFLHHPPFEVPTSDFPFQFDDAASADALLRLIARHEQVTNLFCGHMHRQFAVDLATCHASVTPSLPPDNRLGDYEADWNQRPLFALHRWNPDKRQFNSRLQPVPNG
jgi:3',5'-cyclic AMP phosphodiesterase CpdA